MRKFFRISEVFSRLSGNRADSFAERIRGRKNGRNRFEERKLHLEQLEERQLLAVTAAEYDAIRQAFDFGLDENQTATNVIEVTDLSVDALQKAVFQAGQSSQNDLIVIRSGALDATLDLGGESILVCNDASACGTLSIVAWNEGTDGGNLNLTVSVGKKAFDVAQGTDLQVGNITVNGAAVSTDTKSVSIKAGETTEENYLVIFSGGGSAEENQSVYYDEVVRLYDIARQQYSVKAENIYILYADGTDSEPDQNIAAGETAILINSDMTFATSTGGRVYSASYDNFQSVMNQVGERMDGNDHLLLFTADHGYGVEGDPEVNEAAVIGWNSELISGDRYAQAVFSVTAGYVTLVETQCFSGGVLDKIIDPRTEESLNPNISEADATTKWYGMAAANYYEMSLYRYETAYDATYGADIIVRDSEESFATAFLDAFEQGGDYELASNAFDYAKENDPFTADEKYRNNVGTYAEGSEHPWGAGATFSIFTDWEPERLAVPEFTLAAVGASIVEVSVTNVENASGYTVQWSTDSTFSNYESQYYDEDGTHEIANLKDNTEYYFRVRAEGSERFVDSDWTSDTVITETYELPSIDNAHFIVTDSNDATNQLYGVGVEIAWRCGDFGTISDSFTVLADENGTASLKLEGAGDWDHFQWDINGENNGEFWTIDENDENDEIIATWSNKNNIESPKREFTFVVWNDKNDNKSIDSGEDYNSFTVSVQWANISICVDQPFPGSDEVYFFETDAQGNIVAYSAGHGFWDNRTTNALLNSAIIGNYLNRFANTSEGYGSTEWGIEAINELVETGNFICDGRTQLSPNGDTSLARWSNVDAYKTFTIESLSDYLNLLQYNKDIYENPPTYVQVETAEIGEMQCMVGALNALRAAGFTVESYPQGGTPTGLYDFEYEWTNVLATLPGTTDTIIYNGTSPAHVGQDLVRAGGQYTFDEFGDYTAPFDGHDLDDQNFPQPQNNGSYSVSDMRAFLASLKERNVNDVSEVERAKLQNYLLTLSSYSPAQNVLYLDFGQFEETGPDGDVQGWTGYTLDYDETRELDENGFYAFTFPELVAMYEAWVTTSEDFAPFNLNITLNKTVYENATEKWHALIGGTEADWRGIDDNERPITVFGDDQFYVFASGNGDGAQIGKMISHEAGHSFGLEHWSQPGVELYPGNDAWSPIMGGGSSSLTQWSRGEYPNAINGSDGLAPANQNDIAILTERLGLRPDENNVSIYTASSLDLSKVTSVTTEVALAEGIIGGYWNGNPAQSEVEGGNVETVFDENDDSDYYMFELTDTNEAYHFNIGGILADGITNLDIQVNLYNAAGELLQTYDNADSLNIGFTFGGQTGIYYLSVMGTGKKSEIDGVYSDFASLGMYDIRVRKGTVLRVNTTSDTVNANDNYLSLREALDEVNALDDDETAFIYFENAGTYLLTGGELSIRHSVNLLAEGKTVTINGASLSRVMSIGSYTGNEINVKIDGIHFTGGLISSEADDGAGVRIFANANVEMTNVSVYENQSQITEVEIDEETGEPVLDEETGEPITVTTPVGYGGGIYNDGNLTMTGESSIKNNTAAYGGGIVNYGTFTADNVEISDNTGHGVYVGGGTVIIDHSTLEDNSAADSGGGINVFSGTAVLTETIISENSSVVCGGGAFVNEIATLALDHVTVDRNSSLGHGGGIDVNGGTLHVVDTTVTNNRAFDYGGGISAHSGAEDNEEDNSVASVTIVDSKILSNRVYGTQTLNEEGELEGQAAGGGLAALGSVVFTVTGTLIEGNQVDNGVSSDGIVFFESTAVGGGVYASGVGVEMTFFDTDITTNVATGLEISGGGLYIAEGANVTLSNTSVRKHQTTGSGAGIYVTGNNTTLTVNQTSYIEHNEILTSNNASGGAGIFANNRVNVFIDKSYVQNNAISSNGEFAFGGGLALCNYSYGVITDSEFYMNSLFVGSSVSLQDTAVAYGGGIYSDAGGTASNENLYGLELYNSRIMANRVSIYAVNYADGRGAGVFSYGGRMDANYVVQNELLVNYNCLIPAMTRSIAYGGGIYAGDEVYNTVIAENRLANMVSAHDYAFSGGAGIANSCSGMSLSMINCTVTDNMGFQYRIVDGERRFDFFEYVAGFTVVNRPYAPTYNIEYQNDDYHNNTDYYSGNPYLYNNIIIRNSRADEFVQRGRRERLFTYLTVEDRSGDVYSTFFENTDGFGDWHYAWVNTTVRRYDADANAQFARWERYLYEYLQTERMEHDYRNMYSAEAFDSLIGILETQIEEIDHYIEVVNAYYDAWVETLPEGVEVELPDNFFDDYKEQLLNSWREYWWGNNGNSNTSYIRQVTVGGSMDPYNIYSIIQYLHSFEIRGCSVEGDYIRPLITSNPDYLWIEEGTSVIPSVTRRLDPIYTDMRVNDLDMSAELNFYNNFTLGYNSASGRNNIGGSTVRLCGPYLRALYNYDENENDPSFFLQNGEIKTDPDEMVDWAGSRHFTANWVLGDYHINPDNAWAMENVIDKGSLEDLDNNFYDYYQYLSSHGKDFKDAGGAARLYDWNGTAQDIRETLDIGAYEMKPDTEIAGYDDYTVIDYNPDAIVVTTLWDYVNPNDGVISLREALGYYNVDNIWVDGYANDDTTITFADYLMGGGIYYTPLTAFTPNQANTATFTINRGITIDARNKKENDSIGIYIDATGRLNTDNSKTSDDTAVFEFTDSGDEQNITLLGFDIQWRNKIIAFVQDYVNRHDSSLDSALIFYSDSHSNTFHYDTDYMNRLYSTNIGGIESSVTNGSITIDGCNMHDFYKNGLQYANDNREVEYVQHYTIEPYAAGAVLNHTGSGTTITFYNTSVYDSGAENFDKIEGGAVYINGADLNILGTSFENCFADALYEASGGAVFVENGNVTVDATEKSETSAPSGDGEDAPDENPGDDDPTVCYEYEYTYSRFESNYASADYTTAYNPLAVYAHVSDNYPRDIRSGFDPTQEYVRDAQARGGALCVVCTDDASEGYNVNLIGANFLKNSVSALANNYEIDKTLNATAGGGAVFVGDRIHLTATAADNQNKRTDTLPQITSFIGNSVSAEVYSTEFIATDWDKNPLARAAGGAIGMAGSMTFVLHLDGVLLAENSVQANSEWGTAETFGGGVQACNNGTVDLTSFIYTTSDGTQIELETVFDGNTLSADGLFGAYAYGGGLSNYAFSARTGCTIGCDPSDSENPDDSQIYNSDDGSGAIHVVNTSFNNNEVKVKSLAGYAEAFGGGLYSRGELVFYVNNNNSELSYEQGWIKSGRDKFGQQFNVLFNGNSLLADGNATKNCSSETIAAAAAGGGLYIADWQNGSTDPYYLTYELENIQADNNLVSVDSTNQDICQPGDLIAYGGGIALDDPYVERVEFNGSSTSGNTVSAVSKQVKDNSVAQNNYDYQETRVEGAGLYVRDTEWTDVFESRAARNTGIATAVVFGEVLGGGIYVASSTETDDISLNIRRGRFIDNHLEASFNAFGGGIYYVGIGGMNLSDSSYTCENTVKAVNAFGGGLYTESDGTVTIGCDGEEVLVFEYAIVSAQQSRVYMNSVDGLDTTSAYTANGGGLYVTEGDTLCITDATGIYGNEAGTSGGGIYAAALNGGLNIADGSWLRDNSAFMYGGAIFSVNNGALNIDNIVFDNNWAGLDGGAIYSNQSEMNVTLCTFSDNSAGRYGGAIYTINSVGLTVNESLFNSNTAVMRGGAIYNNTRKLTVDVTQFVANSTTDFNGYGGAICNLGYEQAEINDSSFMQNMAFGSGGAIYNYMATYNNDAGLSIERTDFAENRAGYSANGETSGYGDGGAIYNIGGNLTMTGAAEGNQLTNNTATRNGGAIYNSRGNVTITDYYIENNKATRNGGAVYTLGTQENVLSIKTENITDAQLIDNEAGDDGGAVYTRVGIVTIDGYNITENYAGNNGGAVWYRPGTGVGNLTITGQNDNVISLNTAENNGGALWLYDVDLTTKNGCDFIENHALEGAGGAIWSFNNNEQVLNFTGNFELNTAGVNGGAIYAESKADQTITLTGNLGGMLLDESLGNDAEQSGGGIYAVAANAQKINVTGDMIGNTAETGDGGGIFASAETVDFTMTGDLLNNIADGSGGGVYVYGTGNVTGLFNNSNIQYNSAEENGGALWFANKTGMDVKLTVESDDKTSVISQNAAGENGGAIYHVGGDLIIRYYDLTNNSAGESGGAVYHDGGLLFLNHKNVADSKTVNPATKYNVTNNTAGTDGGAIYHTNGKFGTVALNVQDNVAGQSGGAFFFGDTGTDGYTYIYLSDISNNQASVAGGGIYQETGKSFQLVNVLVSDNTLTAENSMGAGVYNGASIGKYFNTTIAGNEAFGMASQGGGVYIDGGTNTFTNSIVALNEAAEGAQIYNNGGEINASYSVSSIDVDWKTLDPEHSFNYDDPEDPLDLFIDPNKGNYHLLSYSDVAGVGNVDASIVTTYDLDGKDRIKEGTISMGAYENYDDSEAPKTQRVFGDATPERVCSGTEVVLDIWHDASTYDKDTDMMTGVTSLTLRVHYNSNVLTFNADSENTKYVTENDLRIVGGQWFVDYADTQNFDHDNRTDRYIMVSWNNENGWGADELAKVIELMDLSFTAKDLSVNTMTQVNFTSQFLTQGYDFLSKSIIVNVIAPNFDVDDNGAVDLNDVSMIIRYFNAEQNGTLDELDLSDLIDHIGAQRTTTENVANYIDTNRSIFNVDGSRGTTGFTESVDGELLRRYFSGYRNCPLVDSLYFVNANRNTYQSIESYIEHYTYGEEVELERPDTPYHVIDGKVSTAAVTGQSVTVTVSHKLYDNNSATDLSASSLSLRIHYNSNQFTFNQSASKFVREDDQVLPPTANPQFIVLNDSEDLDDDSATNRYVLVTWNDPESDWSAADFEELFNAVFTVNEIDTDEAKFNLTAADLTANYRFGGWEGNTIVDTDVVKLDVEFVNTAEVNFDIDKNPDAFYLVNVENDINLMYRCAALKPEGEDDPQWKQVVAGLTKYEESKAIEIVSKSLNWENTGIGYMLDINGDGEFTVDDVTILERYLDGFTGDKLIEGLESERSSNQVVKHIEIYLPAGWNANALALYSFTDGLNITPRTLTEEIDSQIQGILLYVNAAESTMSLDNMSLSKVTAPVTIGSDSDDERFADTLAEIDQNDENFWDSFDPAFALDETQITDDEVTALDEAILDFNWEE